MTRILLVGQDKGGVGKSTAVRAIAELAPESRIIELDVASRLLEYAQEGKGSKDSRLTFFQIRVDPVEIERTGGQAALVEFDEIVQAIAEADVPTVVDIGANTARPFCRVLGELSPVLKEQGVEIGVLCLVTADPAAIAEAAALLEVARPWSDEVFLLENRLNGPVAPDRLARLAGAHPVATFAEQHLDPEAAKILLARGLSDIPRLDTDILRKRHGMARGHRIGASLTRFRVEAMEAVRIPTAWLIGS